jgi:hypothetical protein
MLMFTDFIEQWEVEKRNTPVSTKWQEISLIKDLKQFITPGTLV